MKIRLSCNGKHLKGATWADVEAVLPELKEEAYFRLTIIPEPGSGPTTLEVQADSGNYRPVMGATGGGGRGFRNPSAKETEMVDILGDYYYPTNITQDYNLIVRMIKEFYHTGNVSEELWEAPTE